MYSKVEAHEVQGLDQNSVRVLLAETPGSLRSIISGEVSALVVCGGLEPTAVLLGHILMIYKEIPEADLEVQPEVEGVWQQFKLEFCYNIAFH